ncbi:suppressor of G2 allele of skp1 [Arctopsyche grandis]|uniref:suppressor of G2 allele of skp1 n=1 Tax=Arctopsyche grandis TaxID=121162 RepID=UPI00406D7AF4
MEPQQNQEIPPKPKIKHDWYQTETHVIVTILLKNAPKEKIKISYSSNSLSVSCPVADSDSEYSLELDLWHEIEPTQCTHLAMPSKVEIKMKKVHGLRWENLERKADEIRTNDIKPIPQSIIDASGPKYPSSCPFQKDWNKIEKEIKKQEAEEKPEGEEALNSLFEQIYGQGSDEVRKAMNKSFVESGGTVLSTNWNEVAKDKVKIQPPDGMEWKKWDD